MTAAIGVDGVARILAHRAEVDEHVAVLRTEQITTVGAGIERTVHERALHVTVMCDRRGGRGQATFTLTGPITADAVSALVTEAIAAAQLGLGPPWRMPPASAPARVDVADPALSDTATAAAEIAAAIAPGRAEILASRVKVTHRTTAIITSTGLFAAFPDDLCTVENAHLVRRVRRRRDLDLDAFKATAARRAREPAPAPLPAGHYDVVLTLDALTAAAAPCPGSGESAAYARYGLFATIAAHADAGLARRGITRLGRGHSVYGEHRLSGDPLTIDSDGTLHHAPLSAPLGPLGEPTRRFSICRAGKMNDLGLDLREAALRKAAPNGNVRNLVVAAGTLPEAEILAPGERPLVVVRAPSSFEINPRTGAASLTLGIAHLYRPGSSDPAPVRAGTWSGDILALLAGAHLATATRRRGWYRGPMAIRIPGLAISG